MNASTIMDETTFTLALYPYCVMELFTDTCFFHMEILERNC